MQAKHRPEPSEEVHIKVDAWTEATMCGQLVNFNMRRQWTEGRKPSCVRCLKSFLNQRGITERQRLWAVELLKKANGTPVR